jgi:hypothetical protein
MTRNTSGKGDIENTTNAGKKRSSYTSIRTAIHTGGSPLAVKLLPQLLADKSNCVKAIRDIIRQHRHVTGISIHMEGYLLI